jgi:predicted AAA+ superfamily ATPase
MTVETTVKPSITVEEAIIQMSASLAKSIDEMSRKMAESNAKTEAIIAESNAKTEAIIAESSKKREEDRDTLDKWIGYFGNSIGNIVELVLIPGIKKKINDFGHSFNSLSPRKQFYNANGKTYAEVDLFLENGEEVMVVEVKTQMSVKEVERQIKRLELLRKNEAGSLKGKIIYSAVAGLQIDDDAREMALGLGMYVVEMVEDTKSVNVIKPSGKLGTW